MTFLFNFVEIILLLFSTIDTLGFIAENRKWARTDSKDYLRICFTWIFFLIFRAISCNTCSGIIGHFYGMLMLLAKLYVTLPVLGGTEKLYDSIVEKNSLPNYIKNIFGNIKSQMVVKEEHSKIEEISKEIIN
jgi:hypothetical protein